MQDNALSLKLRQEASKGNVLEVKTLLQTAESSHAINSNINATSTNGNTALLWATIGLDQCLKKNDKVKAIDYKMVIDLLVAFGADDTCTNKEGKSIYDILFQAQSLEEVREDICAKIIQRELKKLRLPEVETNLLLKDYYLCLKDFILSKIKDKINNLTALNVINFAAGNCADGLALNKIMKILKKPYNYVGFSAAAMIKEQEDFLKAYPQIKLVPGDTIEAEQIRFALEQQEFDLGVFCHVDPSNQQHIACLEEFYPYYLKNNGLSFFMFEKQQQLRAYKALDMKMYVSLEEKPNYTLQAYDRSKSKKAIMLENTISTIIQQLMSFNASASEILWENSLIDPKVREKTLVSIMKKIFSACKEFIKQYDHKFIKFAAYNEMVTHLVYNLANWVPLWRDKINFGEFNFLALKKLIKKIIRNAINSENDEKRIQYLIKKIYIINNYHADYCIELGDFKNAEAFLMRSIAEDMPDAERLNSHAALAYIKMLELLKLMNSQANIKAEALQVIKYNLNVICTELQKNKMDESCNACSAFSFLRIYISELSEQLIKIQDVSDGFLKEKSEIFALLYSIYFYFDNVLKGPRLANYRTIGISKESYLLYKMLQDDTSIALSKLAVIVKQMSYKSKLGIKSSVIQPQKQKKKKKERNSNLNNDLRKDSNANILEQSKLQPALNRSVVNENNNIPESISINLVEQNKLESEQSKTIINENNNVQENITATVKENNSAKFEVGSNQQAVLQDKTCSKESLLFFPQEEQTKANIQLRISAKETKKTAYEGATLHPITSNYLPANTLAGIILPTINDVADNELVKKFHETLSRGKIVGALGKGIKLVSTEECMAKSISNDYLYKIKDPGLDERLYGRRATKEEIKELSKRGIKDCEKYKNIIIFDLLKKHKLQSKRNLLQLG